eukprot:1972245-Rhodomonas_salina.3
MTPNKQGCQNTLKTGMATRVPGYPGVPRVLGYPGYPGRGYPVPGSPSRSSTRSWDFRDCLEF